MIWPRRCALGCGKVLTLLAGLAAPAVAQNRFPPDSLRNLKVLPATTTPREIVGIMRGFASALGVRCQHCHVGEEGRPLETFDFVTDDKRTKRTARLMIQMVQDINQRTLAEIPERPTPNVAVTCETCHRGVARPAPLGQLIAEALAAGGPDSARQAYRALRERYYGRASYDFGEPSLVGTALDLARDGRLDEALAVLRLNDEQFPTSANTMNNIGDVYLARRDTVAALEAYRTALRRDSTDVVARLRLRGLERRPP
ncbi:MAG: c-type cytochrome [Gemmatimonadetes bacterium]|nr:c-type cytochrome [Gemmatimonadota bacterium]